MRTTTFQLNNLKALQLLILINVVVFLTLGYLDEGFNSFQFLTDPGSVVALMIYIALFSGFAFGIYWIASRFMGSISSVIVAVGMEVFVFVLILTLVY